MPLQVLSVSMMSARMLSIIILGSTTELLSFANLCNTKTSIQVENLKRSSKQKKLFWQNVFIGLTFLRCSRHFCSLKQMFLLQIVFCGIQNIKTILALPSIINENLKKLQLNLSLIYLANTMSNHPWLVNWHLI
jgi:hypothetical protein